MSRHPNGQLRDDLESQKEWECIKQFTLNHLGEAEQGQQVMFPEVVKAICERDKIYQPSPVALAESFSVTADELHQAFMDECDYGLPAIPRLSDDDLMRRQRGDPEIRQVIKYLESNKKHPM